MRPGRVDWSTIVADASIASAGLCRGLFEVYMGGESGGCSGRWLVWGPACGGGVAGLGAGLGERRSAHACGDGARSKAANSQATRSGWCAAAARHACVPGLTPGAASAIAAAAAAAAVVADAKKEWANGARKLLESDDIRRQTRKGGSG